MSRKSLPLSNTSLRLLLLTSIPTSPLGCSSESFLLVVDPLLGDAVVEGVVGVRGTEQGLNAKQHRADLESRGPLTLEDVEANATQLVNVGVVNLR